MVCWLVVSLSGSLELNRSIVLLKWRSGEEKKAHFKSKEVQSSLFIMRETCALYQPIRREGIVYCDVSCVFIVFQVMKCVIASYFALSSLRSLCFVISHKMHHGALISMSDWSEPELQLRTTPTRGPVVHASLGVRSQTPPVPLRAASERTAMI